MDLQKAFDAGFDAVKGYVERSLDKAFSRIDALEKRTAERGEKGEAGERGISGVGVAGALIDREGNLVVTLSDGTSKALGGVVGRDGAKGADGANGADGTNGKDGRDGNAGKDGINGEAGSAGVDGKDGTNGTNGRDGKDGADGVAGKDGERGLDGKDADLTEVKAFVADAVSATVADAVSKAVPESVAAAVPDAVAAAVSKAASGIPVPTNGVDGKDGRDGVEGPAGRDGLDGTKGIDGSNGRDGKDGVGVASASINRDGGLILTTSDGRAHELGSVVGKDGSAGTDGLPGAPGTNGKDGADGFGFDDLDVVHDGERGFTFRFTRGDRVKEFPFSVPVQIYRGVYKDGQAYQRGDAVTWGGSQWHCDKATSDKPGEGGAWTLSTKKGRDGRDGVVTEKSAPTPIRVGAPARV